MTCLQARLGRIYVQSCRAEAGLMRTFTTSLHSRCPACGEVSVTEKPTQRTCAVCGRRTAGSYPSGLCPRCGDEYGRWSE